MSGTTISADQRDALLAAAVDARNHAYAPYSNFRVGAALLVDDGRMFTGCNVENVSYGLTICGERSAVFAAVNGSDAKPRIVAVAVVGPDGVPCSPCGACRQVLAEFGGEDMIVMFPGSDGFVDASLGQVLPYLFRPDWSNPPDE